MKRLRFLLRQSIFEVKSTWVQTMTRKALCLCCWFYWWIFYLLCNQTHVVSLGTQTHTKANGNLVSFSLKALNSLMRKCFLGWAPCRAWVQFIEMSFNCSLNQWWCIVPCGAVRQFQLNCVCASVRNPKLTKAAVFFGQTQLQQNRDRGYF